MTKDQAQSFIEKTRASWVKLSSREDRADALQEVKQLRKELGEQIQIMAEVCFFLDSLEAEEHARDSQIILRSNVE